jgi:threonine dehydrogenase-like Zn-dependent dehydrogenase
MEARRLKAIVFDGDTATVQVRPEPRPRPDEALVRVRLAGVCATDLEIVRGYGEHRGIFGHEMVGEVEACASDPSWVGRRVAAEINVSCGACDRCRRGHPTHCSRRSVMGIRSRDGCFAERVAVPVRCLHAVPDAVPDEAAVFTEPLAAALRVLDDVDAAEGERVLVLGDGRLGLLVAMALHAHGRAVTVRGRHAHKLEHVRALGIPIELADGAREPDAAVVVECTGSAGGLADALLLVRPRGTVVLKSTFAARPVVDTNRIVVDEIRLVGSRCGPFAPALADLDAGRIDPRPLLEASYALAEGERALEHAGRRGTLKIVLAP